MRRKRNLKFLDAAAVEGIVGFSRWTIWRHEAAGNFPRSLKIGNKRLWVEREIYKWMRERVHERDARVQERTLRVARFP